MVAYFEFGAKIIEVMGLAPLLTVLQNVWVV